MSEVTVTITADVSKFVEACRRAALSFERLDLAFKMSSARMRTGHRRHGAIKHVRDLRRARAKRLVALYR